VVTRGILRSVSVRGTSDDGSAMTFVAATERGVDTYDGVEHLRMDGADLTRFIRNPVILDSHNRFEAGAVVGRAAVRVEGDELVADVTFAPTARAREVQQLVQGGFLNALSVGFVPRKAKSVGQGETYELSSRSIDGPARIVEEWELYEISVVSVPADSAAVRRAMPEWIDVVISRLREEAAMADEERAAEEVADQEPEVVERTAEPVVVELEEIEEAKLAARIRAIAPRGLEKLADRLILEGLEYDEARERLLEAQAKRMRPIGSPEPEPAKKGPEWDQVSDEILRRSLCG